MSRLLRGKFGRRLVIMVKAPAAGRVKTRLARGIGVARASCFYRHMTAITEARVRRPAAWETILAVAPDNELNTRALPRRCRRIPQGNGDLGKRMQRVMDRFPPGPVVIIGSDVPGLRSGLIEQAFRLLGNHDAVIGPSSDGGYWLIGFKRFPRVPGAFANVRWSSAHARADTERNLAGLRLAQVSPRDDIDEPGDFAACPTIGRRI